MTEKNKSSIAKIGGLLWGIIFDFVFSSLALLLASLWCLITGNHVASFWLLGTAIFFCIHYNGARCRSIQYSQDALALRTLVEIHKYFPEKKS